MKNIKIVSLLLLSIFIFVACQSQSKINEDTNQSLEIKQNLSSLKFFLPDGWQINKSNKDIYYYYDEMGNEIGFILSTDYNADFDLLTQKPNHSSVTNDEYIDIPLGKSRLLTFDMDNGTVASGKTGTHDVYYASIPIKDNTIFILSFSKQDKKTESKEQFIEILRNLKLEF